MGTRIYVGNLPYSTDNAQLSQLLGAYGTVVDAHVITDRVTGQSKGFGFVEMSSEDEARSAIGALNGTTLGERTLKLDEAGERPQRADGHNDTSRNRGGSRGGRW